MSTEQVALESLRWLQLQTIVTALAIVLGPFVGVIFTLWAQGRSQRQEAKTRLFLTLLGQRRGTGHFPVEVVRALNSIDVVFAGSASVRARWHKYYEVMSAPPAAEPRHHAWLELLSEMARDLGYKNLTQVDLDKFYWPQGLVDEAQLQAKVAGELGRVLENTSRFLVMRRDAEERARDEAVAREREQAA